MIACTCRNTLRSGHAPDCEAGTATYLLRDVDPDLWQRVKVKAAREGRPIRAVILALLRTWLRGG